MLTLFIISCIIFFGYNIFIISKFGVPESLSDSFYLLNDIKKGLGYVFSIVLFSSVFTLLPVFMSVDSNTTFDFLKFFCAALLAFVGAAPAFKGIDKDFHFKFAILCAVSGFLWIILATPYWYVLLISAILMIITMLLTNTKYALVYWLEMIMFTSVYSVVALYTIL